MPRSDTDSSRPVAVSLLASPAAADMDPRARASTSHRVQRIAHRGGNDRCALAAALAQGVDWIEVDVWYSLGRLVARHERGLGRLPLVFDGWMPRVLPERPLDLDEIIRRTEGGPQLLIDFKGTHPQLPRAVVRTLQRHGAVDRAALCGQYWRPLDAAKSIEPRIRVFHSLGRPNHTLAYELRLAGEKQLDGISLAHWLATPELLAACAARGVAVFVWTVNDAALASRLVELGAGGVISDRLDLLAVLP